MTKLASHDDQGSRQVHISIQHLRRQQRIGLFALLLALFVLFGVSQVAGPYAWLSILIGFFGILIAIGYLAGRRRGPGERQFMLGELTVTGDTVTLRRNHRTAFHFSLADVSSAWFELHDQRRAALLRLKSGVDVGIGAENEDALNDILLKTRLFPRMQAKRMRLGRDNPAGRMLAAALLGFVILSGGPIVMLMVIGLVLKIVSDGFTTLLLSTVFFGFAILWLGNKLFPRWLSVGTDGIFLQRLRRHFIPYGDIVTVEVREKGAYPIISIRCTMGKPRNLRVASKTQAQSVRNQIEFAIGNFKSRRHAALISGLEQGGQSIEQWCLSLKDLFLSPGYRKQHIEKEDLMRVAEDPGQSPKLRIAAVFALESSLESEEKERVLAVIQNSASPTLRVAMKEALSGKLEEATLASIE